MRIFLLCIFLAFTAKLAAQCPGNGYASSTQLVVNEDFSQGNTDFSSSYTFCQSSNCISFLQGIYTVDKDASGYSYYFAGKDHTTGSGEFFIGSTDGSAGTSVWCQTIRVKPRTNYNISGWFSNVNTYAFIGVAKLQFSVNGTAIGTAFDMPSDTGKWQNHEVLWYSGNNSNVTVCVINKTAAAFYGVGFGIDDLSMRECLCNYPATASKDTTICQGDSITLRASLGNSFIWSPVSSLSCPTCSTTTAKPVASTNYFVGVTDTSGCLSTALVRVTVQALPKPQIIADSFICNNSPTLLKTTIPNAKYKWSTGSTDSFIIVTKGGNYWVDVTVKGCSGRANFNLKEINTIFNLGKDTTLCDGKILTLNINQNADSIGWFDGSTAKSFKVTSAGKYWATLKTRNCSYTDTIEVKYKPNPIVNLGADITLCEGEKIILDAENIGAAYLWSGGNALQTLTVDKAGKYWVQVTANGCSTSDTINIKYQPKTTVDLGKDTLLCEGNAYKLNPKNASWVNPEFLWSDGTADKELVVTQPGKYWVFVKSGACKASDTISINYKATPKVNLGKDISVCADVPVVLGQGIFADKYIWSTGETTQTIAVKKSGTYVLVAEINGCTATDTINVNFLSLPLFSLGNDTTLCEGQTLLLHATEMPDVTYLWQDGFLSPYSTVTKPGTYWAKIDNGTCSYTDTIHVSYNAYPKVELGEDTLLCAGQILTLDANFTGATYFWNDSTSNGIKEITTPGKYWVKVSLGPCSYSDTINVFYKNPAQVKLGNDTTFCGLESWRLDAGNPGADYLWSTGENTKAITVREAGTYWVIADFCGQKATDTVSVGFINYLPENLYMPTAFSPNNDFINDTLRAVGINEIEAFEWRIYNRWGQLVYQTNDINKPWDGKLNGVASPEGLYHWKLALRSPCLRNRDMSRSGVVYLVR